MATKRCSCLRRLSVARLDFKTRVRGEALPMVLGLLSSSMRCVSAPCLARLSSSSGKRRTISSQSSS